MSELRVGLIGESYVTVTEDLTARAVGSGSLEVYSTPAMLAVMEAAAVAAVDPYIEPTQASVGIDIKVQHMAATPIGEHVVAMAEVTGIEGKRVILEVRAWDERELIGEGTHVRYVIEIDAFLKRIAKNRET